jgi:hypothetical protein
MSNDNYPCDVWLEYCSEGNVSKYCGENLKKASGDFLWKGDLNVKTESGADGIYGVAFSSLARTPKVKDRYLSIEALEYLREIYTNIKPYRDIAPLHINYEHGLNNLSFIALQATLRHSGSTGGAGFIEFLQIVGSQMLYLTNKEVNEMDEHGMSWNNIRMPYFRIETQSCEA